MDQDADENLYLMVLEAPRAAPSQGGQEHHDHPAGWAAAFRPCMIPSCSYHQHRLVRRATQYQRASDARAQTQCNVSSQYRMSQTRLQPSHGTHPSSHLERHEWHPMRNRPCASKRKQAKPNSK